MTNQKSTKRALLLSALSLLMCVSMLVGSTFAWFTDSVASGVNKIEAGNLDIDVFYGKEATPATNSVADAENIFTDVSNNANILWEPGVVAYTNLNVVNKGNLALKYQLAINFSNENYIVENGAKLSQVLKVAFLDEAITGTTREEVYNAAKDAGVKLVDLMKSGELLNKDANKIYGVVIYWEPSADDNTWNAFNGRTTSDSEPLHIDLGITLVATQKDAEYDSFGNDYDIGLESAENGVYRTLDDGSTVFYFNEESGYGDRVKLTALPENLGNEYVVPEIVNDLGGALVGATLDKLTIPAGLDYSFKSLENATIREVVIAEGATTVTNRLFYKANVETVVIPDTVTSLEESAFQQVNIDTIVIPASVERVGATAFAASQVKTVIFKGSPEIQNKAFRGCTQLRTVYINGDDVTFINTTGEANCWFCNKESNNPNYSNITFYVKNETVAAKVRTAMGAEKPETTPIYVNDSLYLQAKDAATLQNAVNTAAQDTIIALTADVTGNLTINQNVNNKLVINGNGNKFDGNINIKAQSEVNATGSITIKNVAFTTTASEHTFISSTVTNHYPLNVTISGCTFEGTGADSNVVGISVKSAKNMVIENCVATKMHSILQNTSGWNLTVRDVTVTESGRGMSLGTVQGVTLTDVTVDATKYGVRMDAGYNNNAVITDCDITAFIPVCVRKVSVDSAVTFNGTNTMTEKNTDGIWCAIGTSEYETNGVLPTNAAKTVTVTVNDAGLNTAGICNNSGK